MYHFTSMKYMYLKNAICRKYENASTLHLCSTSWLATVDCVNYMYYKQDIMDSLCIKIDGNNAFILPERNEAIFHYATVCTLVSIMNRICYLLCIMHRKCNKRIAINS